MKKVSIMHNINKFFVVLAVALLTATQVIPVFADEGKPLLDKSEFSIGAGLSINSVSGPVDDELGFQLFGAYDLSRVNLMKGVHSSVEFGYMDYGFSGADSNGVWVTYVTDGTIRGQLGWLARLGLDLGDDSGLMLGAGVSYGLNEKMDMRLEYVARDEVGSLQFNVIYRL